ncbi:hypothetical protein EIN_065400 [Entamoeba invadens IP1]|uniref:Uncharacterized protein n=1 Tax=Entamoeba invadens IP1 TaxID=370355 RepID=A0A0A1TXM0_ENTIV|nr:hypothetical protein EIN_065400 [Entamoeba invadens IP1]ELP84275.1 hypothetical protein EIN_065400 [Entamoeba invadens IP1]|eukprot:XP_004183621.1 hypothetical protein EIN_065400 [Entamoeba invadens IP1]
MYNEPSLIPYRNEILMSTNDTKKCGKYTFCLNPQFLNRSFIHTQLDLNKEISDDNSLIDRDLIPEIITEVGSETTSEESQSVNQQQRQCVGDEQLTECRDLNIPVQDTVSQQDVKDPNLYQPEPNGQPEYTYYDYNATYFIHSQPAPIYLSPIDLNNEECPLNCIGSSCTKPPFNFGMGDSYEDPVYISFVQTGSNQY